MGTVRIMMIIALLIASISFVNSTARAPSSYEKFHQLGDIVHDEQVLAKKMTLNITIIENFRVIFHDCCVQDLESDTHLTLLTESLNKARGLIYPPAKKASKPAEVVNKEHRKLLAIKPIIEKRKELQEGQLLEMELEEETKRQKIQQVTVEAEKIRLAKESYEREQERIKREQEEQEIEKLKALITDKKNKVKKTPTSKQETIDMAIQDQLKETHELEKRLQKLAKTMDHMKRARRELREEEAPLIDAAFHRRLMEGKRDQQSSDDSGGFLAPQKAPKSEMSSGMQIFLIFCIFLPCLGRFWWMDCSNLLHL